LRADRVAMRRNDRLNPQILKGQALWRVCEKEVECWEERGGS
jgi:hypothetical protein